MIAEGLAGLIVLDASVLIAVLDGRHQFHERAVSLLDAVAAEEFGASSTSIAETLVFPARAGRLDEALAVLRGLEVAEIPMVTGSAEALARLRAETSLKMPGCTVIEAADRQKAEIATVDHNLAACGATRIRH